MEEFQTPWKVVVGGSDGGVDFWQEGESQELI